MSKIEWTEETWNPLIGCSKISPGCKNCYAIQTAWIRKHNPKMADRYAGVVEKTSTGALNWTGKVNVVKEAINKPLLRQKPTMYFVNSMSDLFHEAVAFSVIHDLFDTIAACPQHTFQILTKRPARMLEYVKWFQRGGRYAFDLPNVWIGVSVENQQTANERIPLLLQVPAAVRFLSCEPLLGPISFRWAPWHGYGDPMKGTPTTLNGKPCIQYNELDGIKGIDWVIVGGESGKDARPMHPKWAMDLRDQCQKARVAFFFKQVGNWAPIDKPHDQNTIAPLGKNEQWLNLAGGQGFHGESVWRMRNVGKAKAGCLLDGREWNEFPVSGKRSSAQPVEDPDLYTGGFDY